MLEKSEGHISYASALFDPEDRQRYIISAVQSIVSIETSNDYRIVATEVTYEDAIKYQMLQTKNIYFQALMTLPANTQIDFYVLTKWADWETFLEPQDRKLMSVIAWQTAPITFSPTSFTYTCKFNFSVSF